MYKTHRTLIETVRPWHSAHRAEDGSRLGGNPFGCTPQGSGFRVQGLGLRIRGSFMGLWGSSALGLGFRIRGFRV